MWLRSCLHWNRFLSFWSKNSFLFFYPLHHTNSPAARPSSVGLEVVSENRNVSHWAHGKNRTGAREKEQGLSQKVCGKILQTSQLTDKRNFIKISPNLATVPAISTTLPKTSDEVGKHFCELSIGKYNFPSTAEIAGWSNYSLDRKMT